MLSCLFRRLSYPPISDMVTDNYHLQQGGKLFFSAKAIWVCVASLAVHKSERTMSSKYRDLLISWLYTALYRRDMSNPTLKCQSVPYGSFPRILNLSWVFLPVAFIYLLKQICEAALKTVSQETSLLVSPTRLWAPSRRDQFLHPHANSCCSNNCLLVNG